MLFIHSSHSSFDGHLGCVHLLALANTAAVTCKSSSRLSVKFFWGEVGLLDPIATSILNF